MQTLNAAMRGVDQNGSGTGMPGAKLRAFFGAEESVPPRIAQRINGSASCRSAGESLPWAARLQRSRRMEDKSAQVRAGRVDSTSQISDARR